MKVALIGIAWTSGIEIGDGTAITRPYRDRDRPQPGKDRSSSRRDYEAGRCHRALDTRASHSRAMTRS